MIYKLKLNYFNMIQNAISIWAVSCDVAEIEIIEKIPCNMEEIFFLMASCSIAG